MPTYPSAQEVLTYLDGQGSTADLDTVSRALAAEIAAQARVCRIPIDADPDDPQPLPDDLAEALKRRVAHNLELRQLPLGLQATLSEAGATTNRVGGTDAEVRRLERPWRKVTVG
ncbi:MAG: hypothetical protein ACRDQA_03470 [Nocardioidaceae bacterium]